MRLIETGESVDKHVLHEQFDEVGEQIEKLCNEAKTQSSLELESIDMMFVDFDEGRLERNGVKSLRGNFMLERENDNGNAERSRSRNLTI